MKRTILILIGLGVSAIIYAQQKPSDRPFSEEVRKVQERKTERSLRLSRQQPSADTEPTNIVPVKQPLPNEKKPSERPMKIPARPSRQQ